MPRCQGQSRTASQGSSETWSRTCSKRRWRSGSTTVHYPFPQRSLGHVGADLARMPLAACHGKYDDAEEHLETAEEIAQQYPSEALDVDAPGWHRWCVQCARERDRGGGGGGGSDGETAAAAAAAAAGRGRNGGSETPCGEALGRCEEQWCDTNGRFLRMMAVRVMGCDWRTRAEDEADFARMAASPRSALCPDCEMVLGLLRVVACCCLLVVVCGVVGAWLLLPLDACWCLLVLVGVVFRYVLGASAFLL
eukprot:82045-Rhodomonas_salina.4